MKPDLEAIKGRLEAGNRYLRWKHESNVNQSGGKAIYGLRNKSDDDYEPMAPALVIGDEANNGEMDLMAHAPADIKDLLGYVREMELTIKAMQVVAWGASDQLRHYGERLSQEADTLDQVSDRNPPPREET